MSQTEMQIEKIDVKVLNEGIEAMRVSAAVSNKKEVRLPDREEKGTQGENMSDELTETQAKNVSELALLYSQSEMELRLFR